MLTKKGKTHNSVNKGKLLVTLFDFAPAPKVALKRVINPDRTTVTY